MAKAYSDDLRRRILQAYEQREGSEADLARRFRVSLGYVKKVRQQLRRTGKMDRVPHQPGRKPKFSEPIRAQLRSWLQQQPDLTLVELQERLRAQVGLQVSVPSLWVVLRKIGLRLKKKSLHAQERDREANRQRRQAFLEQLRTIPPERLTFLDESGVTTQMTRARGRARAGARIAEATPQGHWQVLTTLGALGLRGIVGAMTVESATDGDVFLAYLEHVLCPRSEEHT